MTIVCICLLILQKFITFLYFFTSSMFVIYIQCTVKLGFPFHISTLYLILPTVLSVLPKHPYTLVLCTQFIDHTFKLSMVRPVAVISSTFKWESGQKMVIVLNSYLVYCLHVCLLFWGFKVTLAEWSHVSC
jgi:hypothetical protein